MKHLVAVLFLLLACPALASQTTVVVGCGTAATCTSTDEQSEEGTFTTYVNIGSSSSNLYVGSKFTASNTYTACEVYANIVKEESPTGNVWFCIFSHDSGNDEPQAQVGTCSDSRLASDMGNLTTHYRTFSNLSASLTSGTTYWLVVKRDANDGTNYLKWGSTNTASVERMENSADGTDDSWTNQSTTLSGRYVIRK